MIAAPPPCVAIESELCVSAPFGDALASQRGIAVPHVAPALHAAAVAALGVEILDDGGDLFIGAPPPSGARRACRDGVCIHYAMSCGGGSIAPYCAVTLYFPNQVRGSPARSDKMLQRDISIRAQSLAVFRAAVRATYIVVRGSDAPTLIPLTKLISAKETLR